MARGEFMGAVPEPTVKHGYHFHFGNVQKRMNSTKIFDYSVLKDEERCDFKKVTSMENPVIFVNLNSLNISPQWNYCHCEETESYYWIRDISVGVYGRGSANIWQFSLELDPLATYRSEILKTKAFIEYGFNSDASGAQYRLQDSRQAVAMKPHVATVTADITDGKLGNTAGIYILSAVGKSGLLSYKIDHTQLETLLTAVSTTWEVATKAFDRWEVALPEFMNKLVFGGTATSCIRSCIWLPIEPGGAGRGKEITLGQFNTGVFGRVVTKDDNLSVHTDIAIPWPAEDWKRLNCQIQLYIPMVGVVGIPVDQCNNALTVGVDWCMTYLDGSVSIKVTAENYCCYVGSTNVSSVCGIGTSNIDPVKAVAGSVSAVGSALQFGGGVGATIGPFGAVAGLATGAEGIKQSIQPINQCVGMTTGASQTLLPTDAQLTLLYYPPIDDAGYQGLYGYPVMRVSTPVNGYCKTRGFSCQPKGAKPDEIAYINAAMDSGVFIE